jgi:hypothetical protein
MFKHKINQIPQSDLFELFKNYEKKFFGGAADPSFELKSIKKSIKKIG